jgi:hypothetical protein
VKAFLMQPPAVFCCQDFKICCMKKCLLFFIFMVLAGIVFTGCKKQSVDDEIYSIQLKECSRSSGENIIVCFDSLITESRCPVNGICVWAGTAVAQFSLHQKKGVTVFTLATNQFLQYKNDTTINNITISLQDVQPYPNATKPSPAPITAILKIK